MRRACFSYGRHERFLTGFWWRNLSERDRVEDVGVEERIILQNVFKK
jgi:hypothetical protein